MSLFDTLQCEKCGNRDNDQFDVAHEPCGSCAVRWIGWKCRVCGDILLFPEEWR